MSTFDCGVPYLNESLRLFQKRFVEGEGVLGYVVAGEGLKVHGYVVLADTIISVRGKEEKAFRCLTVPALAVDSSHQHADVFRRLTEAAMNAMAARQRTAILPYRGILCLPDPDTALERWLTRMGFQSIGSAGLMWLPFDLQDDDSRDE